MDLFLGWIVVAIPFLVTVGATVLALKLPHERHYWKFVWGAIALGVVFSGLTYWQQTRAMRQAAAYRDTAIKDTAKQVAKDTTETITQALGEQYTGIIGSLTSQVGDLKGQLASQGKKVDEIGNSNIVTGKKPISVIVENPNTAAMPGELPLDVHVSSMPVEPRKDIGRYATQFILTTNKVMDGGRARFECKGKINNGTAQISGASTIMGGGGKIDDHTFTSGIESPNWSPNRPLVVTLYYDDAPIEPCKVMLQ